MKKLFSVKIYILILIFLSSLIFLISVSSVLGVNCWNFAGNQTGCQNNNCTWKPTATNPWCTDATGCCEQPGCWMYDGNQNGCANTSTTLGLSCTWKDNQYNQNMDCKISASNPYKSDGTLASGVNIGCCEQPGCWDRDGHNETYCEDSSFMGGICVWRTQTADSSCPDSVGCCMMPFCNDVSTQENCEFLISKGQPCSWSSNTCSDPGFGGYSGADSCIQNGGVWNGTACNMPEYGNKAIVHCWFADDQSNVCGNITGCTYCDDTGSELNNQTSICFGAQSGWCKGHESYSGEEGLPTDAVACDDIKLKSICDCGPVPGCHWTNSTVVNGSFCSNGVSQCNINYGNLTYNKCEDAPNQSECLVLKNNYFMPCKFNLSGKSTCEFDWQSGGGFGDTKGSKDFKFNDIMDENSCTFAGGIWKKVTTDAYGNTEGWCEFGFGAGKETCNQSCWACELQTNGQPWGSLAAAQNACENSSAGGGSCNFVSYGGSTDPSGRYGWCDFPMEMNFFGGGNCDSSCYDCFGESMCSESNANCTWTNDPMGYGPGWCDPAAVAAQMTCNAQNALPCMGQSNCQNFGHNWTNTYINEPFSGQPMWVCIANGTSPEICFVPGDEDSDGAADCADSDCNMDPKCGFGMGMGPGGAGTGGGMMLPPDLEETLCFAYDDTNQSACEARILGSTLVYNGTHRGNESLPTHMNNTQVCFWHAASSFEPEDFLCDPIFEQQMGGGMDMGKPPTPIGNDASGDAQGIDYLDIVHVGIMDDPQNMDIGIPMKNITNFSVCYKKLSGTGNGTVYRYIDSDNNVSTGCTATDGTYDGFDYKLVVSASYNGTNANIITAAFRCVDSTNNTWTTKSASLTLMADACYASPPPGKAEMMGMSNFSGVNVLMFSKSAFGISTKDLRILVATAGQGYNETNVTDQAGPFYYTPGAIDFKMEDCFGFVDKDGDGLLPSKDPDCKFINNLGFIPFEDCFDGIDNNADGSIDCNDTMCSFKPTCQGALNFTASGTDTTSPNVVFHLAQTFHDGAFIKYDTNEPANGTVSFYRNDSTCAQLNKTIFDVGDPYCSGTWCSYDDYKLMHESFIDNHVGNYYALGYNLSNRTTYYYKYKVCDPSGNCAVSSCSNFTTESTMKEFVFGMSAPSGYTVKTPWAANGQNYSQKVNSSVTKDINITIECVNQSYSIKLVGVDIKAAKEVDLTNFSCNLDANLIGMASSTWDKLLFDLSVDYVEMTWHLNGTTPVIQHCNLAGANCTNVTSFLSCVNTTTSITCKIPLTLGFSSYKLITSAITSGGDGTSTGGGSGGGGGGGGTVSAVSFRKIFGTLDKDIPGTYTLKNLTTGVKEVTLSVTDNVVGVKLTITKLNAKPKSIEEDVDKDVYKYVTITVDNIESKFGKMDIKFAVEKSWLEDNGVSEDTVVLYHYKVDKWSVLTTERLNSDSRYVYYQATTDSLSTFAIAGIATKVEEPVAEEGLEGVEEITGEVVVPPEEEVEEEAKEEPVIEKKEIPLWSLALIAIFIIFLVSVWYYVKGRREV